MTTTLIGRRLIKIISITLGVLAILLLSFHFWFKAHARQMIEDLVETKSNGKLKLKIEKFSLNWFTKKMEFEQAVFYSTDSSTANTSYRFSVDRINLKVESILPIVFKKRILIDSITLFSPDILVTRLKVSDKKEDTTEKDVSIPEEMGKVYNSIQDALRVLKVSKFLIEDGKFTLVNNIQPGQQPLVVGNLHFQVDNLQVDTTIEGSREKILFSDNVVLRSHDQDIIFPDQRHRLSFSQFRINLQKKLVEFDSCTIAAIRTDSSAASFTIFLDALKLIDIDFDTLYTHEVIKADSVYCTNPNFNLEVIVGKKKGGPPPKLENIIKQLTGNLLLDNVIVNNADFNIKTIRDGVPSSYTFSENNFEMQGLAVNQENAAPVKVRSFKMAIRNYENFLRDSSYSVRFDSVLFRDDRIYLNNFVFHKLNEGKILNTFNIPQFYLGGLSWDDLLFENKLKAEQATLFNPYISYTVNRKKAAGKQNIFESLAAINDYMDLRYLDIIDGKIDLKINTDVRIQLDEATLSIQSHDLLTSTKLASIKNSLTQMDFKKGTIRAGDLLLQLKDIRYLGEMGKFNAGELIITNREKNLDVALKEVAVDRMLVNEQTGDLFSDNISWKEGNIKLVAGAGGKAFRSLLQLTNIRGGKTTVNGSFGKSQFTARMDNLGFDELIKMPGKKIMIEGLYFSGNTLKLDQGEMNLSVGEYRFRDNREAFFGSIRYNNNSPGNNTEVSIPQFSFIPSLVTYIDGKPKLDNARVSKPKVNISLSGAPGAAAVLPDFDISSLTIEQPEIHFSKEAEKGISEMNWVDNDPANVVVITGLTNRKSDGINAALDKIKFHLSGFRFKTAGGKKFNTLDGKIAGEIREISFAGKRESPAEWKAIVTSVETKNFKLDSLGKTGGKLNISYLLLEELGISTASIINMQKLAAANRNFRISRFNGSYTDSNSSMAWYNAVLSRPKNEFSVDSFFIEPTLGRDSFMAKQEYQIDHITLKTGRLSLEPLDLESFIKDNTVIGGKLLVENPVLTAYRDKRLPFKGGIIKPLPVELLKRIPTPVSIDLVKFNNASVNYIEFSDKTGEQGTVPVTNLDMEIRSVKNYDISEKDSLSVKATATLFDTAHLSLELDQSYTDTLSGFLVRVKFKPLDLTELNPVLSSLANLQIKSGFMDSAFLRAVGREYLAFGEMKMNYRDLKVIVLKTNDDGTKKPRRFISFLANTFVIKNNNDSRTGVVFIERDRERSAINYLVKIAMSGFGTNIGGSTNKKQLRKYNHVLKEKNLPPVNF